MAKLDLSILGCAPLQIVLIVHLSIFTKGDLLEPPENLHFPPDFFHHILNWSHNRSDSDGILYQVEYLRYGSNWTAVPNCTFIGHHSCDLTVETLPMSAGYYARVRSVLGNQTSEWTRTRRYTFTEVSLPPPSVQVDVDGPSLLVQITLPIVTSNNITRRFEDYFPINRIYHIDIQRTSDNYTFKQVKCSERFHITGLVEGQEYCIQIQPAISSRSNVGEVSSEICIYLPEQGVSNSTLLVVASCILTFVVLLIFVNVFICIYTRGVVKTPITLKSLIQRSWSWMDKPSSSVIETTLHWENHPTENLMPELRDSLMRSSADSGFGSQIFATEISKSSQVLCVGESLSKSKPDITNINTLEEHSCEIKSTKSEDSGISLSTDSQNLINCWDSGDDRDIQTCGTSIDIAMVHEGLGYLRQQEPEENTNILESKELESTWQPQIKEYLSQGPQNHQVDFHHQKEFHSLLQPWIQLPEAFQSSIPLTVAYSPFSNKLWDLGVSVLSLGDVEQIMDTRS